jgi:hypothetical protein
MKSFEILSALPQWSKLAAEAIVDSPAFAMPCRLGNESTTLVLSAMPPADAISLSVTLDDEAHILSLGRSPRFKELEAVWDNRADVPEPILLALVEKDAGVVFQLIENAVHKQLKLVGLAAPDSPDVRTLVAQVDDIVFAITRTPAVVSAIGNLRNLDLAHESIRSTSLRAVTEYAAFALSQMDVDGLEVGDAVLLPEIGTVPAGLIVDGRFAVGEGGVSRYAAGGLVRVVDAEPKEITLGEVFDAAEASRTVEATPSGPLTLVADGRSVAAGHLDRLGEQPAFIVESTAL